MYLNTYVNRGLKAFTVLLLALFMISCGPEEPKVSRELAVPKSSEPAQTFVSKYDHLLPLPAGKRTEIIEKVDAIDYIFYDADISMSTAGDDAKRNLDFFINMKPKFNPGCKTTGRMIFLGEGEILIEADFYFTSTCQHFIFFEGDKAIYANAMSDTGVNFMNSTYVKSKKRKIYSRREVTFFRWSYEVNIFLVVIRVDVFAKLDLRKDVFD